MPKCTECGSEIVTGSKFCSDCGAACSSEATAETGINKDTYQSAEENLAEKLVPSNFGRKKWLLPMVAAFLIIAIFVGYKSMPRIPNVVGSEINGAAKVLARAGVVMNVVGRQADNNIEKNCVISQDPVGGSLLRGVKEVNVVISSGPETQSNNSTQSKPVERVNSGIRADEEIAITLPWEPTEIPWGGGGLEDAFYGIKAGNDGIYFWIKEYNSKAEYYQLGSVKECYRYAGAGQMGPVSASNMPQDASYESKKTIAMAINKAAGTARIIDSAIGNIDPAEYSAKSGLYIFNGGFNIFDMNTGKTYNINSKHGVFLIGTAFDAEGRLWAFYHDSNVGNYYLCIYGYDKNKDMFVEIGDKFIIQPKYDNIVNQNHKYILRILAMPNGKGVVITQIELFQTNEQLALYKSKVRIREFYWQS